MLWHQVGDPVDVQPVVVQEADSQIPGQSHLTLCGWQDMDIP